MNVRRGFTLIELLVVFAIIAILAAILIPVFASAKPAQDPTDRQVAASINNARLIGAAALMYASNNDDHVPMHLSWQPDASVFYSGCGLVTWGQACMPYMPNAQILSDPLAKPETPMGGFPPAIWFAIYPQYGMNYTVWSAVTQVGLGSCENPFRPTPLALTGVARPAEVPLFVSKSTSLEQGGNGAWWSYGGPGNLMSTNIVDPPDCNHLDVWCFGNWGRGGNWSAILARGGPDAGQYTGGNSRRRGGNHVVLLGDGHARWMSAAMLAVGTSWKDDPTWPSSSMMVTDPTVYRWTSQ